MRDKLLYLTKLLLLGIILMTGASCEQDDDVLEILTNKVWRLTYNPKSLGYVFEGDADGLNQTLEMMNASDNFTIQFSGAQTQEGIRGTFTARATNVTFTGTWTVDGSSRKLSFAIQSPSNHATVKDANKLGNVLLDCIRNATAYSGDVNNLFIKYKMGQTDRELGFYHH